MCTPSLLWCSAVLALIDNMTNGSQASCSHITWLLGLQGRAHKRWKLSWIYLNRLLVDLLMGYPMIVFFICCTLYMHAATIHVHDTSLTDGHTTYKICHIDIDTSLDKVVDLLHQAIPTCLH